MYIQFSLLVGAYPTPIVTSDPLQHLRHSSHRLANCGHGNGPTILSDGATEHETPAPPHSDPYMDSNFKARIISVLSKLAGRSETS
jgi:hypothetical protein